MCHKLEMLDLCLSVDRYVCLHMMRANSKDRYLAQSTRRLSSVLGMRRGGDGVMFCMSD